MSRKTLQVSKNQSLSKRNDASTENFRQHEEEEDSLFCSIRTDYYGQNLKYSSDFCTMYIL